MIARLSLTDFRNHGDLVIEPGPGFVVLTGPNGAGKTNILEAVSMLAPGRGLRRASLRDMARQDGSGGFSVAARLADGNELGTGTKPSAPERRQLLVNGAAQPLSALAEHLSILWLTPSMDRLFVEGASERRRFLDRLVLALEPCHAIHATRYEAAMRARTKLLSDESATPDADWLAALEARMAEHGAALGEARMRTAAALGEALALQGDGDFPRAALALDGWDGGDLATILRANRHRDAAAGRATEGPHRQDLIVEHLEKRQPAALGSTGEQKALLIGLVLAHAEMVAERRGAPPILLLDEVAAHLDPDRRAALYRRLEGRGQVWMTGTEPALFEAAGDASRFSVMDGAVRLP